jgi:hypothetical protein
LGVLRRPVMSFSTTIRRLLVGFLGLVVFQSAAALADSPPGSVYVPLDSWVYAAFDRLAGLGSVNKQFVGLRPWTRIQCAQLVLDADASLSDADVKSPEAAALYDALSQEFSAETSRLNGDVTRQARVESVYTRAMGISGTPLRDGSHFGQTLANDFGRPFNTGFNNVTGFSAQASAGRFFAYVRGEYQHSPAYAGLTSGQQTYLQQLDGIPSAPYSQAMGPIDRFDLLDTYVGMRLGNFDVTFGKQSLWLGPGTTGPMLYSDNIDPVPMLKINTVDPIVLPGFLKYLGPIRGQAFIGRLSSHYPPGPYIHGEKIVFKPTPNFEIGLSRTTVAFGQGIPMTFQNFFATYFSVSDICCVANPQNFPGKRQGGLDFSYRLPHLRRWLTIYSDSFTADDVSPVVNPGRAFHNPGIYLSRIPRLPKADFRFELANTRWSAETPYTSFYYREGYTNKGYLIGNTVGRHGSAFDVSSTYWLSPWKQVQIGWREQRVSNAAITSGGSQDSLRVKAVWLVQKEMEVSFFAQHERWRFPFLATGKQSDNVVSLQFTVYPKKLWVRSALRTSD